MFYKCNKLLRPNSILLPIIFNQKLYLLKYKTVGWVSEVFDEFIGGIIVFVLLLGLGMLVSLFLPDKCVEQLDGEGLMALGGFVFIVLPCLIYALIRMVFERKDKKK